MIEIKNKTELQNKLVKYRRELHENPELSFKEYETTKRIRQWLIEEGISILDYSLPVGLVAEIVGDKPGPVIALRADIDALPIKEETNLPFASQNHGIMHACGHDFHTASILGTAILLNQNKADLCGTVRIIFQPGEETAQGANVIIDAGVLNGVRAILGMHNRPNLPVGTIGVKPGPLMASVDRFEIDVVGIGGHAGMPDKCIDPIVIGSQIVSSLQTIVSRSLNGFSDAVISVTRFQAGRTWNVIPDKAELEGTVRTFQNKDRDTISTLMKRTAEGVAAALGARVDFRWFSYTPVVDNEPSLSEIARKTAEELGLTVVDGEQVLIGEDFAAYQNIIPGLLLWVGVGGIEDLHHPSYTLNEDALTITSEYFANLAVDVLQNNIK